MEPNKINDAIEFLNLCQKVAQKTYLDKSAVYSLLENYKIKESDIKSNESINPLHYYRAWKASLPDVYSWGNYWTGFDSGRIDRRFIKIYISLDRNRLFEGVKQLFAYLESENISHTSKATSHVRTDNVIIRLNSNDYDSLAKICEYVEHNLFLQEGMNKVNPFLPTIGNIGVMYDDGRSYNSELANLISIYINRYAMSGPINFYDFARFIKENKKDDFMFLQTFNQTFFERNIYEDIVKQNKLLEKDKTNIQKKNPKEIFELGIITAFEKYGKAQAIYAVSKGIQGDYSYFSRVGNDELGNKIEIRSYLENNMSSEIIKSYVFENNSFNEGITYDDIIRNYVDSVIYKYKGHVLEEALFATSKKHNDEKEYIAIRINEYAKYGNGNLFSSYNQDIRPNYNYRKSVIENIIPKLTYEVVDSILFNNGIEYKSLSQAQKVECCSNIIMSMLSKRYV